MESGGTRQRLLAAATEIIADEGVSVPMSRIAEHARVSRMTLYRNVGTREEMLVSVLLHEALRVGLTVRACLDDRSVPFPERLVSAIVAVVDEVQHSKVLTVFVEQLTPSQTSALDERGRFVQGVWGLFLPYFQDPEVASTLRDDPESTVDWVLRIALMHLTVESRVVQDVDMLRHELRTFLVPSVFTV